MGAHHSPETLRSLSCKIQPCPPFNVFHVSLLFSLWLLLPRLLPCITMTTFYTGAPTSCLWLPGLSFQKTGLFTSLSHQKHSSDFLPPTWWNPDSLAQTSRLLETPVCSVSPPTLPLDVLSAGWAASLSPRAQVLQRATFSRAASHGWNSWHHPSVLSTQWSWS